MGAAKVIGGKVDSMAMEKRDITASIEAEVASGDANLERSGTMNIAWLGADRQSEYRRERNRSGPKQ
jgi:hypothetical protein